MLTAQNPDAVPSPRDQPALSIQQVAQILGVSYATVNNAARAGDLPSFRVGGHDGKRGRLLVPTAKLRTLLGLDQQREDVPA